MEWLCWQLWRNRDKRVELRLEIERAKATEGYVDLKERLGKAEKDLKQAQNENTRNYELAQDMMARLNNSDNVRNNLEKENKVIIHMLAQCKSSINEAALLQNLRKQVDENEKSLEILRRQLEDEVVLRTELENRNVVLSEDLEFARRTHANVSIQ